MLENLAAMWIVSLGVAVTLFGIFLAIAVMLLASREELKEASIKAEEPAKVVPLRPVKRIPDRRSQPGKDAA